MAGKRISALTEQTGLSSGDFFGVDNAGQTESKKLSSDYFTTRFNNVQNDATFPTGDAYSSSSSYKVGDYVTHDDVLYRCKTACSAASWTVNATNFEEASLTKAVTTLNASFTKISYQSIAITSSTKYSDLYTLVNDSLTNGKNPYIASDISFTASGVTYTFRAILRYGALSTGSALSFSTVYGRTTWEISVGTTGTTVSSGSTTTPATGFNNATLIY